ncbi:MAG: hypothetical protein HW380_3181 [Magnetococcales bacterium]|nr:hypothetical protein [Magnetococcales bacterium]
MDAMKITYDPVKREKTLRARSLDFERANEVFARHHFTWTDLRKDYGESRFITVGKLDDRMVMMAWTRRRDAFHIISLRKANDREQAKYGSRVD